MSDADLTTCGHCGQPGAVPVVLCPACGQTLCASCQPCGTDVNDDVVREENARLREQLAGLGRQLTAEQERTRIWHEAAQLAQAELTEARRLLADLVEQLKRHSA
jgi:hypothetical protein